MVKITYCDDSWIQQGLMDEWLKYYTAKKGVTIEGVPFSTGNDLMAAVEHGASFDIYILDIILPGMRGTEVAEKLRDRGDKGKIIYLTSSSVFSEQSEKVHAIGYLVKPIQPEQLYELLDRAIAEL